MNGRHRKPPELRPPRWHDRPRAWLRTAWHRARGREEEQDAPWCASPWCSVAPGPHPRQPECPGGDHRDYVGFYPDDQLTDDHGNHIGQDLPPVQRWPMPADDRPVIQAVLLGGETIILDGEPSPPYNPAWMPCWSRQDVSRPAEGRSPFLATPEERELLEGSGWVYGRDFLEYEPLPDVPPPGDSTNPRCHSEQHAAGPGHLSAFASPFGAPGRIPSTPRPPREPVTWWRPRECGGRITALAGAW